MSAPGINAPECQRQIYESFSYGKQLFSKIFPYLRLVKNFFAMGMIVNPSNGAFLTMLNSMIYVDKSLIIRELNKIVDTRNRFVCVSRPRRFGKSMAKGMLMAYYSRGCKSHRQFKNLKISQDLSYRKYLNKFNVIALDCVNYTDYLFEKGKKSFVSVITRKVFDEMVEEFPDIDFSKCQNIADCIIQVYKKTGIKFVILIDEYDLPIRAELPDVLFQKYLNLLLSLFKSETTMEAIALAYITGILPIVREKTESKLNNFDEYTFLEPANLSEFTGFTEEEVEELCNKYNIDFQECLNWYEGYTANGIHICNPHAVVQAITKRVFKSYWSATGTYETFAPYIKGDYQGIKQDLIKMLAGGSVPVKITQFTNTLTGINTKDNLYTFLLHTGFLAYNADDKTCRMPNLETQDIWGAALENTESFRVIGEFVRNSEFLLKATLAKDGDAVASALEVMHTEVTSNMSYNHEQSLQSAIDIAYMFARTYYSLFNELPTGKGYADVVFVPLYPNWPAMIIELKRKSSTESALNQIRRKEYSRHLAHYKGKLLFIGVNYDDGGDKKHTCEIVECEK